MRTCSLLFAAIVVIGILTRPAAADIPLPNNLEYVQPTVQFAGVDELKDYVFQLRYLTFTGAPNNIPHRYAAVASSKAFTLNAQRRIGDVQLLAMKRDEFAKRSKADPTLKWLTAETEGVLAADVDPPDTTAEKRRRTNPINKYKVSVKDGQLTAEYVEPTADKSAPPSLIWWLNVTLAALLSLALVAAGWYWKALRPNRANRLTVSLQT